jgi:histidyl-tRNA synthetase
MPTFQTVRGTRDLLPNDARRLRRTINKAAETAEIYGYKEVITPILECYDLFDAKSGEEIRARMFLFEDLGGRQIVLRPEFTASIARLVTASLSKAPKPLRIFSVGTVYRYDEPQQGRYREFWQSNFELMGSNKPEADAEIILLTNRLLKKIGLREYTFKLGHVGILRGIMSQNNISEQTQNLILQKMDKKEYNLALRLITELKCRSVFRRLFRLSDSISGKNPVDIVKRIKRVVRNYDKASIAAQNLLDILNLVTKSGCKIGIVDPVFARGLEYYTGMIFEVYIPELEIALGGGGRYDKLIEVFGGEPTPAVGVAHGLDRITLARQKQALNSQLTLVRRKHKKRTLVIPANQESVARALKISELLRKARIRTEFEAMGRKLDKALKKASRRNVDFVVIVDKLKLPVGKVVLQNLQQGSTEILTIRGFVKKLKI